MSMIGVLEAEQKILATVKPFMTEMTSLRRATERVLAEPIYADRDMPAANVSTMDGVAIRFSDYLQGVRSFAIVGLQPAGSSPIAADSAGQAVEITTGAELSQTLDTVIPYEDIEQHGQRVDVVREVARGQYIRKRAEDVAKGCQVVMAPMLVTPGVVAAAATCGVSKLKVYKLPDTVVITTGSELRTGGKLASYQIRPSNGDYVRAALDAVGVTVRNSHIRDDKTAIRLMLARALETHEVLIISGGISKGRYDFIPDVLVELGVNIHFHGVQQKPGKPFLFGTTDSGATVFSLPGNPVSAALCMSRYVIPWYHRSMGLSDEPRCAVLSEDIEFEPRLQYFRPVRLTSRSDGVLVASPLAYNSSGHLLSLVEADAFIELPAHKKTHKRGEAYRVWSV